MCFYIILGIEYNRVLLAVTDAAPYMKKAMSGLSILYPKMVHLTCFAHALHRLAEFIRSKFENVNQLISELKMVFLKSPARRRMFLEKSNGVLLPPKPIITRWCTWLKAAFYCCEHFDMISNILNILNENDAECIVRAKQAISSPNIRENLIYLKSNFEHLTAATISFEKTQMELSRAINILTSVLDSLGAMQNKSFHQKLSDILSRNPGYGSIKKINDVLSGTAQLDQELSDLLTTNEIPKFKYMPVSSCEVERVFSVYKTMLRDNRRSIIFENFKKLLVVKCNQQLTDISTE